MRRREFFPTVLTAALGMALRASLQAQPRRRPRILLRSSWQVVNIGDIAHTPGVLTLLERYLPEAEVRLWAGGDLTEEVAAMEHRRFPDLQIVKGRIDEHGRGSLPELEDAIHWADFLLHGSGPSFVAHRDVAAWVEHTGKPFGVYGITYSDGGKAQIELLTRSKFVYFRDSVSLAKARSDGIASPVMEFGPDGAFACDLRNDAVADAFLAAHGLETGRFVCCIPRLRHTPYWLIRESSRKNEAFEAHNREMEEHDHAPLRDAIAAIVREAGLKVLVCPEDMTHMAVGKRNLIDKLPADVAPQVVWREHFWLTDEALSTYIRSAGLFGLEMHSPIMCIGNGIPAVVCRFQEQTSKGYMWRDIGLGDWLFDADNAERMRSFVPTVLSMVTDRAASAKKVAEAQAYLHRRQRETLQTLRDSLPVADSAARS